MKQADSGAVRPESGEMESTWPYRPILVIGPLPPPLHGVATCMADILGMQDDGIPLLVVDTADRRGLENIGRLDPMNVWLGVKHATQAAWAMVRHRPAVVFLFISQGPLAFLRDFLFILGAVVTGRTLVIQLQGGYFRTFYEKSPGPLRALIRWSFRRADRVLVLGEKLRPIFDGLVPDERLAVLPNAVDVGDFEVRCIPPAAAAPVVAFLATVSREKGALDVLRAVPAVRREVPDVRVRIAGTIRTPEIGREIEQVIAELALSDAVEIVGVVTGEAKKRFLSEADVFAFPSRYPYEGHPYVVLEAMASGLPVVTTDQGCITETVRDGENGVIVPQGDVAAIAAAVVSLLRRPEERAAMGRRNRERVESLYDVRVWRRELLHAFRIAQERRSGRER